MSEPIAYLKGHFVPASECVLPIFDLGIVLGASVTDFLRTFHQQTYRIEDHVQRFYRSCKYAHITPPVSIAESMTISEKLVATNSQLEPGTELGLVYYITAGENHTYAGAAGAPDTLQPTYVQHTFPFDSICGKPCLSVGQIVSPLLPVIGPPRVSPPRSSTAIVSTCGSVSKKSNSSTLPRCLCFWMWMEILPKRAVLILSFIAMEK